MSNLPRISPEFLAKYQAEIGRQNSPTTVSRKNSSLKHFFSWAQKEGHVESNPFEQDKNESHESHLSHKSLAIFSLVTGGLTVILLAVFLSTRLPVGKNSVFVAMKSLAQQNGPSQAESGLTQMSPTPAPYPTTQNPQPVKSISGVLGIEGPELTLSTEPLSDGNITLSPDGNGSVNIHSSATTSNTITITNSNLTTGNLISGYAGNNGSGYNLLYLFSGSLPVEQFSVDARGNTYVGGSETVVGDINLSGNLAVGGVTRLNSLGRLASITGYYQDSGLFAIDQGSPDSARITKFPTSSQGPSSADVLTLTLNETNTTTSNYDTLVLERNNAGSTGYALDVKSGNANFEGNVSIAGTLTTGGTGGLTAASLNVTGATTLSSTLGVTGATTLGATTAAGRLTATSAPTSAHTGTWAIGSSTWNQSNATIYINPASATADSSLLGLAVGGSVVFDIDAEGDIYGKNLILTGSTSTGSQTVAGDFAVEGNTTLGDATSDTLTVNPATLTWAGGNKTIDVTGAATRTLTVLNSTTSQVADLDLSDGSLKVGGTTRISNAGVGTFITGTVIGSQTFTTNNIADSGALTIASGGTDNLTLNTSDSSASISLGANTTLAAGKTFTWTTGAIDTNGKVGIGTASPGQQLEITGNFKLPTTTTTTGIIYAGTNRFIHNYGSNNAFVGIGSGNLTMTGTGNAFFGYNTGPSVTSGSSNAFFGSAAGSSNTTALANSFFGASAGGVTTTGSANTFIGTSAGGSNVSGTRNTYTGMSAGLVATGNDNAYYGYASGGSGGIPSVNSGNQNSFFGSYAGTDNNTGVGNVYIGYYSETSGGTGSYNTFVGTSTIATSDVSSSIALGYAAAATASNQLLIGADNANGYITDGYLGRGATTATPTTFSLHSSGGSTVGTVGSDFKLIGGAGSTATTGAAGGSIYLIGGDGGGTGDNNGGNVYIYGGAKTGSGTAGNTLLGVNSSGTAVGNVGIGTTSPAGILHVAGQCVAEGTLIKRRRRKSRRNSHPHVGGDPNKDDLWILDQVENDNDDYIYKDVPVEDIEHGDEVLSLNDKTGEFEWHKVEKTMDKGIQEVFQLYTRSGLGIQTTANHPYLVKTKAGKLETLPLGGTFEVDQSNRIEEIGKDSFLAITSKTDKAVVKIPSTVKRVLLARHRKTHKGIQTLFAPTVFANSINLALKQLKTFPSKLAIDLEYPGFEDVIRRRVLTAFPKLALEFKPVGKSSQAHILANFWGGKRRKSQKKTTAEPFEGTTALLHPEFTGIRNARGLSSWEGAYHKKLEMSSSEWVKVAYLKPGMVIATTNGWEPITKIYKTGCKLTFDLQIEGAHNFVGNEIVAHNTSIFGAGEAGTPTATTIRGAAASGTNVAGTNLTFAASNGTGTGGSGSIIFRTAPVGSTGSTANTLATRLTINNNGNVGIGATDPTAYILQVAGNIGPNASPTLTSITQTATAIDTSASGYPSVAIGTDGLPVIAYYDGGTGALSVYKCSNTSCSTGSSATIDSGQSAGQYASITIGTDGLPVISYYDGTNFDLKVVKCGNASCSSGNTTNTLDSTGDVGIQSSIAIGTDGYPVISYNDSTNGALKVIKCADSSCTPATNTTNSVDTASNTGYQTSIAIGTDGYPVISYLDGGNGDLKVAKCGNGSCTPGSATISTPDTNGGSNSSIAIGKDGLPIISYFASGVKVYKCSNASCASGSSNAIDNTVTTNTSTSIAIGTDGLAIIAYDFAGATGDLKVVKCGNASCSSGNTTTNVESTNRVGFYVNMAIGADSLPIIAHYDLTNADIRTLKCATTNCATTTGSALAGGYSLGGWMANSRSYSSPFQTINTLQIANPTTFQNLSFLTAGSEKLTITPSGTIGIGTTSPGGTLSVVSDNATGTTTSSAFNLTDSSLTTGTLAYLNSSSIITGKLLDVTATNNTWTGNGTTNGLVDISSSSTAGTASSSSLLLNLTRSGANANASHIAYGLYSAVTNTGTTSTNVAGYFTASGATNNYAAIFDAGNVGIGITTPTSELHLVDNVSGGMSSSTLQTIASTSQGYTSGKLLNVDLTQSAATGTSVSGNIASVNFAPTYSTAITTPAISGNTLNITRTAVTNSSFVSTLTVSGALANFSDSATQTTGTLTSTADVVRIAQNYTSNSGAALDITQAGTGLALRVNDNGTFTDSTPFAVDASGNVGIGLTNPTHQLELSTDDAAKTTTTTWTTTSDARTKKNITAFLDGLDVIKKLKPIEFDYNGLGGTVDNLHSVSLIAQDAEPVAPYLVRSRKGKLNPSDQQDSDILSFNPHGLFFVTINAIKELDQKMSTLTSEVVADLQTGIIVTTEFVAETISTNRLTAKQINADKVISPVIEADQIQANKVTSNVVTSNSLEAKDATVSGTLVANDIQSSVIDKLKERLSALSDQMQEVNAQNATYKQVEKILDETATGSATLASTSGESAYWRSSGFQSALDSTREMNFANTVNAASDFNVMGDVNVFGTTRLANTYVQDEATVSSSDPLITSHLSLGTNSISVFGGALQILASEGVDIMNGTLVVDTSGNVHIKGDLFVGGSLHASTINMGSNSEFQFARGGNSATTSAEVVASIDASGSATLRKLVIAAPQETATPSAQITNNEVTSNSTAGQAVMPAGLTTLIIGNPNVTNNTLIYVTPQSSTNNQTLYVLNKVAGSYFTVAIDRHTPYDIKFNWWIIDLK